MAFTKKLAQAAGAVEIRLAAWLDHAAADGAPDRLVGAMRHGTLGGGKRLRPFLVLETAALFEVPPEIALNTAAAVECVHCYSLVHDDLPAVDNDDLRRGRPTVHKAYDDWTAILAGDALLTLAFEILADSETHADAAVRAALSAGLARASGGAGMVGGQCLDLQAEKLGDPAHPESAYIERLQAMKTGALLRFSCEAGGILGGARSDQHRALAAYGAAIGVAFQIADDLLDLEGDPAVMGKAAGKDEGKATLHTMTDAQAARTRLADLEAEAIAALSIFGASAEALREAARFIGHRQG